jgi:hypothetical protein
MSFSGRCQRAGCSKRSTYRAHIVGGGNLSPIVGCDEHILRMVAFTLTMLGYDASKPDALPEMKLETIIVVDATRH